jgi:transcriptional regulator with XRE-family HTH domain
MFKCCIFAKAYNLWSNSIRLSMTIGEHIMLLRKQKGISQSELGKKIGTSGDIIGRYERDLMTPGVDVIIKISDALSISIDYLVGKTTLLLDQDTLKRLEEINALNEDAKSYILQHVDMMVRDFKNIKAYSK